MGIRQWARDHVMKEPAQGVLKVTSVDFTDGPGVLLTGVVTASGVEPTPVQRMINHPRDKSRAVFRRLDLPVVVDRTDPRRIRIQWDAVPEDRYLEFVDAARLAERMREAEEAPTWAEPDEAAAPARPGIIQPIHTAQFDGAVLDLGEAARRAAAWIRRAPAGEDAPKPPSSEG